MRREVRWSAHASHQYIASLATLTQRDSTLAIQTTEQVDSALKALSLSPTGMPGAVPTTYEYKVHDRAVIVYTLSTTTLGVVHIRFP